MVFGNGLEVHAAELYTKEMFRCLQRQLVDSMKYNVNKVSEICVTDTKVYAMYLNDASENGRRYKDGVCNRQLGTVKCNCQMFSHSGEICRHILRYFICKSIYQIPANMILPRWTKDTNKSIGDGLIGKVMSTDLLADQTTRYNHLMMDCQELASKAACSIRGYQTVLKLNAREKAMVDQYDPDENMKNLQDDDVDCMVRDTPPDMGFDIDDETH